MKATHILKRISYNILSIATALVPGGQGFTLGEDKEADNLPMPVAILALFFGLAAVLLMLLAGATYFKLI